MGERVRGERGGRERREGRRERGERGGGREGSVEGGEREGGREGRRERGDRRTGTDVLPMWSSPPEITSPSASYTAAQTITHVQHFSRSESL